MNNDQEFLNLRRYNEPIHIDADMESIIERAMEQNFVPVIDDGGIFIGIIRRREITEYCSKKMLTR